jgi:hypothetical protein
MFQKSATSLLSVVLLLSFGCENAADQQERAIEAQSQAEREKSDVQAKATREAERLQGDADRKVAEAQANFSKMREDYRHGIESKLVGLDENIAKLSIRADEAKVGARAASKTRLQGIREKRAEFQKELSSMESKGASEWDAARAALEKEWDGLHALVSTES